ncbi:MAG: tRNA epoxyqueuosine(34) reductase QueG [Rhodocyclales bacterium]|nr:tRNA epoxyqueuosine(34) reductase QueG [Rhodocyclales bacterium]MDD3380540.1 tRNA epoxyqueuosine(34) reductase QueG [Rugosibacter sp.]MBH1975153.1 tRNA epoxyqueuosine(34) reductase QueG [Rhodocyclales bacterium]HPB90859.1 tRNA epoxyqueuosine(34) reductase QueG [Rugosibacter sp.]HQN45792.1 tRNA epoxyqueuosine(34) reductase QueG [Rugosibacter sp.]
MRGMHNQWLSVKEDIRQWGLALGFDAVGFSRADTGDAPAQLAAWLAAGFHGEMDYMAAHVSAAGAKRALPEELVPGTQSIITVRMNYRTAAGEADVVEATLKDKRCAYISRYALGRDYHKVMRARLQALADRMTTELGEFTHRVFTDSAPVMEVQLAQQSGLGWRGKHTLLLHREAGSYFFLGEIYSDLPLPPDTPITDHCGSCTACIDSCPTKAIVAPYQLDARRCISYLTIELKSSIPESLRTDMGNRIYGCDDCQLACPWNRFAPLTQEADFLPRHALDKASLIALFAWTAEEFEQRMAGSAIRRIGYARWLRNLAVALGNAPTDAAVLDALYAREHDPSPLVREHVAWAIDRHKKFFQAHTEPRVAADDSA